MSNEPSAGYALVTGSSSGIGLAIADWLLRAGWRVTGVDVSAPVLVHPAFDAIAADLSQPSSCREVAQALSQVPDALVHAAGILRAAPLGSQSDEDGQLMWRLHVQAASALADVLVPRMAARGSGRVVLLGSRVSNGLPGRGQYAATKAAVIALARSWAAEVASQGVTVNVVSPGATATAMLTKPGREASVPRMPPVGRLIESAEIAALVAYLLGPYAGVITGQNLTVCGGASLSF